MFPHKPLHLAAFQKSSIDFLCGKQSRTIANLRGLRGYGAGGVGGRIHHLGFLAVDRNHAWHERLPELAVHEVTVRLDDGNDLLALGLPQPETRQSMNNKQIYQRRFCSKK